MEASGQCLAMYMKVPLHLGKENTAENIILVEGGIM